MKLQYFSISTLLLLGLTAACSSLPERPERTDGGAEGYTLSRNQACLLEAQRAWNFGRYAEVERALVRWQGPMEDPQALTLLGQAAFATQKFALAAEIFSRAFELAPQSITLASMTGRAQEAAGRAEEASRTYARALRLQPDHAEAAVGTLRCLIALSDAPGGLRFARQHAEIFGNHAEYTALAADLAFAEADFEQAIAWTRDAQRLGALHPGGEERLILALSWTGQHEEAVAAATPTSIAGWAPEVHRAVGRSGLASGQHALAARHFQSYLSYRPEDGGAWFDLARAQFLCGSSEKALASAERALAVGAEVEQVQPFLDRLVPRHGNSLQAVPASSAKEMVVSPRD
jgi:tetratricopeptide (TPR) repeat protein